MQLIQTYDWPGNIRELVNVIHRAVVTSRSPIISIDLNRTENSDSLDLQTATTIFQKELIQKAITLSFGNKEAAKKLGLSRSTFFRYQSQLGLGMGSMHVFLLILLLYLTPPYSQTSEKIRDLFEWGEYPFLLINSNHL